MSTGEHWLSYYSWRGSPQNPVANFGDRISGLFGGWLGRPMRWRPIEQADIVIVGSVLEHLPKNWAGTICGAGKLHRDSDVNLSKAAVYALRGEHTRRSVRGLRGQHPVLGDPALLVPYFVPQPVADIDLGIVPHWSDTQLANRYPQGTVISADGPPIQVIQAISRCKQIISSSLHGVIVADAYGIPRQAEIFEQAEREGGDFKFRDYASVYQTNPHFGRMWRAPADTVAQIQRNLAIALAAATDTEPPPAPVQPPPDVPHPDTHPQISLLVPFRPGDDDPEQRQRLWDWLTKFWACQLPTAELIIGHEPYWPFSKAAALNNAASRARGRVFVQIDADALLNPAVIQACADDIEAAVADGRRKWIIPHRRLYRLNPTETDRVLASDPCQPYDMPSPPPDEWIEPGSGGPKDYASAAGYKFGALAQIYPREAFFRVGGWDTRARGWGSEDAAAMRCFDTLYAIHEVSDNDILHLHHYRPGEDWRTRRWVGQFGVSNSRLAQRYAQATAEPGAMRQLAREHAHPVVDASNLAYGDPVIIEGTHQPAVELPTGTQITVDYSAHIRRLLRGGYAILKRILIA